MSENEREGKQAKKKTFRRCACQHHNQKEEPKEEEEPPKLEPSTTAKSKIQRMSEALTFTEECDGWVGDFWKSELFVRKSAKYQLNYLNLRARAEPIRLLLHYVKQPYDEQRESFERFAKNNNSKSL